MLGARSDKEHGIDQNKKARHKSPLWDEYCNTKESICQWFLKLDRR